MEKKKVSVIATAGAVAAVLIGGGITVALASAGGDAPAGTEQLPPVSVSESVAPSSTSSAPTVLEVPVSTPAAPVAPVVPAQPPAPMNNGGMTEPQQPQPEPPPVDENGVIIRTPAQDTPPPPPPPPNGQPPPEATSTP
ncbi:hypothetical protein PV646_28855 [Streptomyces sp. ID05-26A]|nr:hypothetical protein [Streptomyces sp. ID05-26A]